MSNSELLFYVGNFICMFFTTALYRKVRKCLTCTGYLLARRCEALLSSNAGQGLALVLWPH